MKKVLYAMLLVLILSPVVNAVELAGVRLPDEARLDEAGEPLILNGAGIRKKLFFSIYVAGLYLPQPLSDAEKIISQQSPKRVSMHMVYSEVDRKKLIEGWNAGFSANLTDAVMKQVRDRLDRFNGLFETLHKGDEVLLDYLPDEGTRVSIKGSVRGTIPGADFNQALLRVWLGKAPVTKSLKADLLGQ